MQVIFYNKDGMFFSDAVSAVATRDGDVYWSASREGETCAKKEIYEDKEKYYVKKCFIGPNSGNFANPYGPLSKAGELSAYDSQSDRRHYEYVQVDQDVFNSYLNFLVTRNPSYLRNSERLYLTATKENYGRAQKTK